jgi:enoyl-CoA hydratase
MDTGAQPTPSGAPDVTTYRSLRVQRSGIVAEVVLTGPGKGNSLGPDFWREIPEVFAGLDRDDQVQAVILRGEGSHFSYGLDLPAMVGEPVMQLADAGLAAERTQLFNTILRMQEAGTCVAECRKPVIAAVAGWCIGAGLDLIAACDVRLCSADARFSLREVKVAIVADIGSLQRLPAIIGQGNTRELALTGKDIDAAHAQRIGLVNEVYATPEALLEAARAMARQIAENPPLVVQGIKRVLNEAQRSATAEGLRHVALWNAAFMPSHDLREAFAAFLERRPPRFEGR